MKRLNDRLLYSRLSRHPRLRELIGYFAGSVIALLFDVTLLVLFVEVIGWSYLPAAAVSFSAGAVFLYVASTRAIFHHRRLGHCVGVEFGAFFTIGLVGLLLTQAGLFIGVEVLAFSYLTAKLFTVAVVFWFNYLTRWLLLFSRCGCHASAVASGASKS